MSEFPRDTATTIYDAHQSQTLATVNSLKAKYAADQIFFDTPHKMSEYVLMLKDCQDVTDHILWDTNQWLHSLQAWDLMKRDGITDPDMLILAFIHDLGKIFANAVDEPPENVFCCNRLVGNGANDDAVDGCGLDALHWNFGHDEIAQLKLRTYVPEKVAFAMRYHSARIAGVSRSYKPTIDRQLNESDRTNLQFLDGFVRQDLVSKRRQQMPPVSEEEAIAFIDNQFDNQEIEF